MSRRRRAIAIALVTAASATALSGCAVLPLKTFDDTVTITDDVSSVRFDGDSGSITIVGVDELAEVTVHRELKYRFSLPDGETHRVSRGELSLEDCGSQCSVSYLVEVPAGIPVSGVTSNGSIDLSNLSTIDVETSNGRIVLADIVGAATVETSNGRVEARGLRGGVVEARSSNGSIDLETDGEWDVAAHTSNGSVTLQVPDGDYRVDMESDIGSRDSAVTHDPNAEVHLELKTSNGSVKIERR